MDAKVVKNYAFNMAYQILIILLPVITTPYVSRCLGVDNVGIYSFTSSICSYFICAITFGFHVFGQREIAKNQHDQGQCTRIFVDIQTKKLVISAFVIIIYIVFSLYQKKYINYYIIQIISLLAVFFDISYFFQGLELYKLTVIVNGIVRLIGVVCIFIFIKSSSDLGLYIIISCLVVLIGNLSLWLYLGKFLLVKSHIKVNLFSNLKVIFELFIPIISIQLYFNLDKTMLGLLSNGPTENGYYEQALKIVRICQTVITSLGGVLLSSISRMIKEKREENIRETIQGSIRIGILIAVPMSFGLLAISDVFVPCFFGDGYSQVSELLIVLSPIIILSAISNIAGNGVLIPTNRQKYVSLAAAIGAGVNIIFNAIFIPRFFAVGAAVASVIAEIAVLVIQCIYASESLELKTITKYMIRYIFAGVVMLGGLTIIKKSLFEYISPLALTSILIISGMIIYFIILMLERDSYIIKCIGLIKKKHK